MRQFKSLPEFCAGADEAGRGPLAGPVVCAAVILDKRRTIDGLKDSKALSEQQRELLAAQIRDNALAYAIVEVSVAEIDRMNILQASLHGMALALAQLRPVPELALIDGNRLPKSLCCPTHAIVRGDALYPVISAASILAKTHRDALMFALDQVHPHYGFAQHKGYPTPEHLKCLQELGPCAIHRRSFAPVRIAAQRTLL